MNDKYERFVYHVDPGDINDLVKRLKKEGRKPWKSREFPCEPMHPKRRAGYTPAGFWKLHCVRQGSWFRTSPYAKAAIFVTEEPIEGFSPKCKFSLGDFRPPRMPTAGEEGELLKEDAYLRRRPEEWEKIEKVDAERRKKARERIHALTGVRPEVEESFEEVFARQCANHANHLSGRFAVEENGQKAPYSITDTAHTCCSCMEMFGIIAEEFRLKYVTLCPGPVLELGLPPDAWFRVEML